MQSVILSLKEHKGEDRIFVEFADNKEINNAIMQVAGIQWSRSSKNWHLPAEKNSVRASYSFIFLNLQLILCSKKAMWLFNGHKN